MKWIYDIETYPNCCSFAIIREDGKHAVTYEVSTRKNEIDKVFACLDYLAKQGDFLVGFNSLNFDYPVLHKVLQLRKNNKIPLRGENLASKVYQFAQEQIESMKGEFASTVPVDEHYVKQIDLFKIHHFDNKAKSTSLKMLEFNMRASNISDLPFPVGKHLTSDEIDVLLHYNAHDVKMTLEFYKKTIPMIEFREQLTSKYNRNFMNHNDTKIGKDYFIMRLEEEGIPVYIKDNHGRRKANQTKRSMIKIKDCLFDYYDFTRTEFIAIHEWFKKQVITETKGVFSDIEEHLLGDVAKYAEMVVKRKKFPKEPTKTEYDQFKREHPCGWVERVELKAKKKGETQYSYWGMWRVAETLNVVIDGFRFDFGVGGIHGSLSETVVKSNKKWNIVDLDVSSFYPNLAISNRIYPKHLTDKFCDIYKDMYEQRKSYKKGTPENAMLKLALNGTYGESNNPFGVFYDPQFTMSITVGGQLTLCLLIDMFYQNKINFKMVMANTDGITVVVTKEHDDSMMQIVGEWEKLVKLEMERVDYDKMFIRDVNSYIGVYKE